MNIITADDIANRVAALHAVGVDPETEPHIAVQRLGEMNLGFYAFGRADKARLLDLIVDAHRLISAGARAVSGELIGRAA